MPAPDTGGEDRPKFKTVRAIQVEIPRTTRERYITGVYALNIPAPEGTTGDWHDVFHWRDGVDRPREVTLGGETNDAFGDLGVHEARDELVAKGLAVPPDMGEVYVANHVRAILDLLHRSLTTYGRVLNLTGATSDWLDTEEQRDHLLELAERLAPTLDDAARAELAAWITGERDRAD